VRVRDTLFIGGDWVHSRGGVLEVENPATEEVMGSVPDGTVEDLDRAVDAARAAAGSWSESTVDQRAKTIQRMHEGLVARLTDLGRLIATEMGMPLPMATLVQAGLPAMVMGSFATIVNDFNFSEEVANSLVVREPVGVVGALTPWNYPLHQVVAKVAPALAAGCTIVVKPSELAPLSAFVLAEVAEEAGLPAGVLNVVTGNGAVLGRAIATHRGIDMVSFTGSTRTGKDVAAHAAATVKRVSLELGGKSASVVLDDADLSEAVRASVSQSLLNSGQTCIAWSRLVVPRHRHDEAAAMAAEVADGFTLGDPLSGSARLGPLVSLTQKERVLGFIRAGIDEGASLVTGGPDRPEGLDRGHYVRPTVFAHVDNAMSIASEEIFGPVLSIISHDGDDDAVRIANDSVYGLHGAVFSADTQRAMAVARRLRTGQVDINSAGFNHLAPTGGFKESGVGRELGRSGLEEYLEIKSIQR